MPSASQHDLSQRILSRLETLESDEPNAHLRDDYRIAWVTVLNASRGMASPHFWATYSVLKTAPDLVWGMIEARRHYLLGSHYEEFFGVAISSPPPKKPAASVRLRKGTDREQLA